MGKRIGRFGLVNYADHPTNKNYKVFNFNNPEEAELFEKELTKNKVWFEKDEELHREEVLYLFAVEQKDFQRAQHANFIVSARTRKPMISNKFFRYALVLFFFALLALAIIGYVKN